MQQKTWGNLLVLLLYLFSSSLTADEAMQRQILIGARLLPAVMAAYEGLVVDSPAQVRILILHNSDTAMAQRVMTTINEVERIGGIPVQLEPVAYDQLDSHANNPPQGIFLAEPAGQALADVIDFSQRHGIISFSPFRGDVERGILAGMQISDRVLPFINRQTLSRLPYEIKPFFLRVAISHEP